MTEFAQSLSSFDTWLFHLLNGGLRNDFFDVVMPYITRVRYWRVPIGVFLAVLFFFGGRRGRIVALLLVPAIAVSDVVGSRVIRHLYFRMRPCAGLDDVNLLVSCARSSSLPSIHALNMFTAVTVVGAFYGIRVRALVFSIATLVGFSRVYVGAHYPLDVLAGALIGLAWGMTLVWTWRVASAQWSAYLLQPRDERA